MAVTQVNEIFKNPIIPPITLQAGAGTGCVRNAAGIYTEEGTHLDEDGNPKNTLEQLLALTKPTVYKEGDIEHEAGMPAIFTFKYVRFLMTAQDENGHRQIRFGKAGTASRAGSKVLILPHRFLSDNDKGDAMGDVGFVELEGKHYIGLLSHKSSNFLPDFETLRTAVNEFREQGYEFMDEIFFEKYKPKSTNTEGFYSITRENLFANVDKLNAMEQAAIATSSTTATASAADNLTNELLSTPPMKNPYRFLRNTEKENSPESANSAPVTPPQQNHYRFLHNTRKDNSSESANSPPVTPPREKKIKFTLP